MVKPGPASQTGRKRDSSDIELEENLSEMKKQKVVGEEDSSPAVSSNAHAIEELKTRIKKYLEENRNLKYIDIELMSQSLHSAYPEYRRRKIKVFKSQVDGAFKSLTEVLANKSSHKKSRKSKKIERSANVSQVEEISLEDETTVRGRSMNSRLSNLYGTGKASEESIKGNEASQINIEDDECEVIEDDNVTEVAIVPSNDVGANDKVESNSPQEKETLSGKTEFERTQLKVKELAAIQKAGESVTNKKKTSCSPKSRTPSKNLSAFLSSSSGQTSTEKNGLSSKVIEREEDNVLNVEIDHTNNESNLNPQFTGILPSPVPCSQSEILTLPLNKANLPPPIQDIGSPVETPNKSHNKAVSKSNSKLTNMFVCETNKQTKPEVIKEVDLEKEISKQLVEKQAGKRSLEAPTTKKRKKMEINVQSSQVTFADFGGNEDVLCNICKLLVHLKHPEVFKKLGVSPPRGFLLHGPPGCGKTLLAHAIAGELDLPFIKISAPEIVSGVSGESEQKLRELFDQALANSPCVLFIDEIDSITPKRENAQREMERRIVAQLLSCLDDLGDKPDSQVVVIGATNRPDSLDPALRRAGRFDREIGLGIPDIKARKKIIEVLCKNLRLQPNTDFGNLALLTPGYVGADLTSLTREASMAAVNRVFGDFCPSAGTDLASLLGWLRDTPPLGDGQLEGLYIEQGDWKEALKIVQPSAKREGFATVPDVTWADVGALETVREELQLAILAPVRHQEQFSSLGLPQSSGVLLVGPPGCGKTLVAKAIANEAGINFISVKGPELLNMYVGESERAVRSVFQRAKNSRPCVIFFDELDSLCPKRSSSSTDSGSSSRVVNQLLTEMDGVEGRAGVWIMAATNRPDILDPAVLRPGRLDKILYVGFPGPRDRVEILKALTRDGTRPTLGSGVSLKSVGEDVRCEGFSGADVGNLIREASMSALKENLKENVVEKTIVVDKEHFERAFSVLRPSVGNRDREKYEAMGRRYGERKSVDTGKRNVVEVVHDILSDNEEIMEIRVDNVETGSVKSTSEMNNIEAEGDSKLGEDSQAMEEEMNGQDSIFDIPTQPTTSENSMNKKKERDEVVNGIDDNVKATELSDKVSGDEIDEDFVLETFVTSDDIHMENVVHSTPPSNTKTTTEGPNSKVNSSKSNEVESASTGDDCLRKISILTPEKVNMSEITKFYSAISEPEKTPPKEVQTPGVELRFLQNMVVRVMDTASVAETAGKTGKIMSVRMGGEKATVKLDGIHSTRIVPVKELEPQLPEDGDSVKSLVWGSDHAIGEMISLDEDDNALVKFGGEEKVIQIDMLCKVE